MARVLAAPPAHTRRPASGRSSSSKPRARLRRARPGASIAPRSATHAASAHAAATLIRCNACGYRCVTSRTTVPPNLGGETVTDRAPATPRSAAADVVPSLFVLLGFVFAALFVIAFIGEINSVNNARNALADGDVDFDIKIAATGSSAGYAVAAAVFWTGAALVSLIRRR